MQIIYGETLTTEQHFKCQQMALECGILFDTARLLFYRGIDSVEKAKSFLNPGKHAFHDPLLLNDMDKAVSRIKMAKERQENVLVFGDYDADGICASAVLYYSLKDFGIMAGTVIPEREEGYGLNFEKIFKLHCENPIDLLITVDCGISDYEVIEKIKALGIDVIVTDHHEPPSILPDCIKINPKIENQPYPFNGLCGAGVAFKLGSALIGEKVNQYLDFTALATVADSMELVGENRDIVVEGLKLFNGNKVRSQFKCLVGDSSRLVSAQTLAYTIAPRINAGGRMGNAELALKLFLTKDENEIFDYTTKLVEYNIARQVEVDNIYKEAKQKIYANGLEDNQIILVGDKNWKAGFIGIVAAKLVEDYCRPVIVFAGHDGYLKGSARSVEGVNIYEAICSADQLLLGYGGHSQAAGVSVDESNFEALDKHLNDYIKQNYGKLDRSKKVYVEWNVDNEFSMQFAKEIDMLEPYGVGNRRPLFTTTVTSIESTPLKPNSPHYSFRTNALEMLQFNGENDVFTLSLPIEKKVVFETNLSTFRNKQSLRGYVKNVLAEYGDFSSLKVHVLANELDKLKVDNNVQMVKIGLDNVPKFNRAGTMFAISNVKTKEKYPMLEGLNLSIFANQERNSCASILLSPKSANGFDRVVYLDQPLQPLQDAKESYLVMQIAEYKLVENLTTDRTAFATCFANLKALTGKSFKDVATFVTKYFDKDEQEQMAFALTVFLELKIFYVKNGIFWFDSNVKNPLTNSKVYSKICLINS